MATKQTPIAKVSLGTWTAKKLEVYDDHLEFKGKSYPIKGAKAEVKQDTRGPRLFFSVEGPDVAISAQVNGWSPQKKARAAAAAVNSAAARLEDSEGVSASAGSAAPDRISQLERLGKLRESGVLTEDEFQAQKAALLAQPSDGPSS